MIFTTKNNEIAILGQTLSEVKKKLIDFNEIWMQGGRFGSGKQQLIPTESLIKELSFDEAKTMLDSFNKSVINGELTLDQYFKRYSENNDVLKTYVTTTDQQTQSVQGLIKASQDARAAQLAHNEAIKAQTFSAKAGKVALSALATAGNMLAIWVISKGIETAIKSIDNLVHSAEHCRERVNELMSSYQSAMDKANTNAKTVENLTSRYEELSRGVNRLGETYGLTEEETKEYHNICNQIADMFPALVQGYTNESNAILALKGNVEQLRDVYKEAQLEAYNMLIASGKGADGNDILKNAHNVLNGESFLGLSWTKGNIEKNQIYKEFLEALLTKDTKQVISALGPGMINMGDENWILDEFGIGFSDLFDFNNGDISETLKITDDELRSLQQQIKARIQKNQAEIDLVVDDTQTLMNAYLMTNEDYNKLDEQSKNVASILVNSIDENIVRKLEDPIDVGTYVTKIIDSLKDNPDNSEIRDNLLKLFTTDFSNMAPDEAKDLVSQYISSLADVLDEDTLELKVRFGFEHIDSLADSYNAIMHKAARKFSYNSMTPLIQDFEKDISDIDLAFDRFTGRHPASKQFVKRPSGISYDSSDPSYRTEKNALEAFAKENFIHTQDEITFWNKCIEESDTRQEVMDKYLEYHYSDTPSTSFSEKLSASADSFDKFQSSVKSAAAAYTTLLTGNYSSSELLDSIQAISQAASDMGQSFDWESIAASDNPLQAIQDAIESVSQSYAGSVLNGAGIDVDSKFGQLLANIVQESYASESALSVLRTQIDSLQNAYDALTSIVDSYNKTGSINFNQLETLLSMEPQYLACLMDENGQLLLNQENILSLANQRLNDAEAQAVQQAISELGLLAFQAETNAVKENASAFSHAANDLAVYNGALAETIGASSIAASTIRDLNAAISGAKSDGADDTQVDTILNNLDTKLQLIRNTRANLNNNLGNIMGGGNSDSRSGSGASSARSEFSETIDFFKERLQILDDALSHLDATLDNLTGSFGKNSLIDAQLGITEEKFRGCTDALALYTQKADEAFARIPAAIASSVKDGAVALTDFVGDGNKDVVEAIKDYQSWADEISACKEQLAKLEKEIRQLELEKFNNIMADFNHQFDLRSDSKDLLSKQIDLLKETGALIGESFYTAQIHQSRKQLELLETEKAQLINQMTNAVSSGKVRKGADEWLEMVNALSDVDASILDCKKSMEELDNSVLALHTEIFNRIQEQFSNLDSEISNILDLFDEFEISDEKGVWSKEGLTQLGLLTQQYELSQYQIQQYNSEMDELNKQYLAGRFSATEYADKLASLSAAQWDAVKASQSVKDAIMDLNEARIENQIEGIEKEIDAYRELTDAQIEALKASKDLHEYENSIAEKTKSVTDLQRQIAAMQNDTSAATVAKRKQLEEQLAQAKKDLEETEYQHSIEVQEDALNKQYEDYEKTRKEEIHALREALGDREAMLSQSFETVKANASFIGQEITWIAAQHGLSVSGSLISSWQSGENAIASYGEALSQGTSAFIGNIMRVENEVWNLQAQADTAADSLAWMFSTKADALVNELAASYYCEENLQTMTLALQESLTSTLERGYDTSGILTALNGITAAANTAASAIDKVGTGNNTSKSPKNVVGSGGDTSKISFSSLPTYADGTRASKGGILITDEQGYEAKFPRLSSGQYTLANEGTQIFTKEQTDNLYRLSKLDPTQWPSVHAMEDLWKNADVQMPAANRTLNHYAPVQIGNLVNVEGSISSSDIRQMESIADRAVNKLVNRLHDGIMYGR